MAAPSAGSPGFVRSVVSNPFWLAGGVASLIGWVVQAVALDRGQLFVVQPIISLQVVFALPLGIMLTGQRVHRLQWLGAVAVVVGLAVFLEASAPASGRDSAPASTWLLASLATAAATVVVTLIGRRRRSTARAACFGAAAGILFGFQAAVTKEFVQVVPDGVSAILHSWSTYAMIVSALIAFYLCQASLQVGVLAPSLAAMNVATPATSLILGRVVFLEVPSRTTAGAVGSLIALGVLLFGLAAVSRSEPAEPSPTAVATG
jgi:drug/metabolite transporter (DMT)-like permease